jgi:hypothetical protein
MKKLLFLIPFLLLALAACSGGKASNEQLTVDDVVKAFEDEGLAENAKEMTKDDFGMAPMKSDEAKIFSIPSMDGNGRILSYENDEDLEEMKEYYDKLGEGNAMFFSWTIKKDNILIQLNGDLPEEDFNKYKEKLESM